MNRKYVANSFVKQINALVKDNAVKNHIYHTDSETCVQAVAEFEDMGGVLIAYPGTKPTDLIQAPLAGTRQFGIPDELIIRMQQANKQDPVHIFILCADDALKAPLIERLKEYADNQHLVFDEALIHFVAWDTDTYWTRDYAPWWIKNVSTGYYGVAKHQYTSLGGGSVGLVEGAEHVTSKEGHGIFRPNDDYAAVYFSDYLNAPIRKWNSAKWPADSSTGDYHRINAKDDFIKPHQWFNTGLMEVGGNYMVNGAGMVASTYLVAKQNELPMPDGNPEFPDASEINARMEYVLQQFNQFMGINQYMALVDPSGTYIGHIDCWSKFLAKDKVLLASSEDEAINAKFDQLQVFYEQNGFTVYRMTCQDVYVTQADDPATTAAYTNSLILNHCVYVPIAGGIYANHDEEALNVYRSALPDYEVHGILARPETPWLGTDALHCRTHGIPRDVVNNWLKSQMK